MDLANMSAESAAKQLTQIKQREEQRLVEQGNGKAQVAFARDVKNSLLFQYDWGDLLSAAPLALSLMGSCYVAATSPLAHTISLEDAMPKDGFKHIKYPSLKACLVQVSDAGRIAFIRAEKNMDLINSTSVSLGGYMSSISQYLPALPDPGAEDAVTNKLRLLKDGSDDCLRYAQGIEEEFNNWLLLVCELHQVTVAKEGKTDEAQEENENKIVGLKVEAECTESTLKSTDEMAKTLKENLDSSRKLFEKAAKALPGPWESIGLSFANNISTQAVIAIGQGLTLMMNVGASALHITGTAVKALNTLTNAGADLSTHRLNTLPEDSSDPAYPESIPVSTLITSLATLLGTDTNEDIDWDNIKSTRNAEAKTGLTFLKGSLDVKQRFVEWTNKAPSCELKKAITMSMKVIEQMEEVVLKDNQLMSSKPSPNVIGEWQNDVKEAKALVTKLSTTAQSLPGVAPGTAPTLKAPATSAQSRDRTDKLSALTVAVEKMNTTQAAYTAAQENYAKASKRAADVGSELARINANLKSLTEKKITMEGIKKILIQCIGTLIQMKDQITNLVRFFGALSAMVEHVVKRNVKDFIQQVESAQKLLIGNISLLDISRQELYVTSLMCQAYFSLFSTIAKMYTKISIEHIMPGVKLCDKLSMSVDGGSPSVIAERVWELHRFSDNAQTAVRELVLKTQRETAATLDARVKLVAKDTRALPQLPPAVVESITSGKEAVTRAVSQGFDDYQAPAVMADTCMSPDEI